MFLLGNVQDKLLSAWLSRFPADLLSAWPGDLQPHKTERLTQDSPWTLVLESVQAVQPVHQRDNSASICPNVHVLGLCEETEVNNKSSLKNKRTLFGFLSFANVQCSPSEETFSL